MTTGACVGLIVRSEVLCYGTIDQTVRDCRSCTGTEQTAKRQSLTVWPIVPITPYLEPHNRVDTRARCHGLTNTNITSQANKVNPRLGANQKA
ncbi:hypothetical protein VNO80_30446 [Phaseolus coccineus]|uniref:Uncharacterized protein n=1 Tax=Phaseolus coccineus TaxID=3886 RepID=A0AAN9LGA8_PHACN